MKMFAQCSIKSLRSNFRHKTNWFGIIKEYLLTKNNKGNYSGKKRVIKQVKLAIKKKVYI